MCARHIYSLQSCPTPSQATASKIAGLQKWITNEYLHCGIREAGKTIFERLVNLTRGGILPR